MAVWSRLGHLVIGGAGSDHSGIVFARPDGSLGLIEPGHSLDVDRGHGPLRAMAEHVAKGDWVRIRRRACTADARAVGPAHGLPDDAVGQTRLPPGHARANHPDEDWPENSGHS